MLQALTHPDAVYRYSIWAVALLLAACGIAAAVLVGITVERVFPASLRRRHNALTAAILSIVGLTFGVLLAFVAMLAWERFDAAQTTASREAAILLNLHETAAALLGMSDLRLHLAMTSLLSLSGVLVLVMIVALGHPFQGDLRDTPEAFDHRTGHGRAMTEASAPRSQRRLAGGAPRAHRKQAGRSGRMSDAFGMIASLHRSSPARR